MEYGEAINNFNSTLASIDEDFAHAEVIPQGDKLRNNVEAINKRADRIKQAEERAVPKLEGLHKRIEFQLNYLAKDIERKRTPLLGSDDPNKQAQSIAMSDRAKAFAYSIGNDFLKLMGEYNRADVLGLTDYKTYLIEWGEFAFSKAPVQTQVDLVHLKNIHHQVLGIPPLLAYKGQFDSIMKRTEEKMRAVINGYGTEPKTFAEWLRKLDATGMHG